MFDEYFTPPSIVVSSVQEAAAPRAVDLADSPMSTSIDQDAPSSSTPSTPEQEQSLKISQGFEESPKTQSFVMIHLMNLLMKNYLLKGNFMPPKPDLSFSVLEEFVNEPIVSEPTVKKPVVETSDTKASADKPKVVRKNNGAPIIMPQAKIQKKIVKPSFAKIEFVKSIRN
ncbi:hypothetical protein Tco_0723039 [Tanacetum coccineum]